MWIIAIAWMYVALMMALAEATSTQGSILGAVITFLLYGLGPLALVMYIVGTPARRKARLASEEAAWRAQQADASSAQADADSLAPGDAVSAERKEL